MAGLCVGNALNLPIIRYMVQIYKPSYSTSQWCEIGMNFPRIHRISNDIVILLMNVKVVDGWELNGEYFPSPNDHHLPMEQRVVSECGNRLVKHRYVSSQNAALVQYRITTPGEGFSLRVRFIPNPQRNIPFMS